MEFLLYFLALLLFVRILMLQRKRLPPSPWGLPLIGHLHLLDRMIHQSLQKLSNKFGDVMFLRLGMVPAVIISSPAMAKEVLKTHDLIFSSRPFVLVGQYVSYNFKGLALASGDHWKNVRKICTTELFTVKRIDSFLWVRVEELCYLISSLAKAPKGVDMREHLTVLTFNITSRILMSKRFFGENLVGEDLTDAKTFKEVMHEVAEIGLQFHIGQFVPDWLRWIDWSIPRVKRIFAKEDKFFEKVITEHKKSGGSRPQPDFTDILLQHYKDEEVVKGTLMEILIAGMDTSACTVEWALLELVNNPEVMKKAQEELDVVVGRNRMVTETDFSKLTYLEAVIKETLRLHPPVPILVPHMSNRACVLAGFDVPKGATTIINFYSISRDPNVWEHPTKFWPERFEQITADVKGQDFELIPFGAGRRMCPGMSLGLKTVHLVLSNLLHSFHWERVPGESYNLDEGVGSVTWPKSPLQAQLTPRLMNLDVIFNFAQ